MLISKQYDHPKMMVGGGFDDISDFDLVGSSPGILSRTDAFNSRSLSPSRMLSGECDRSNSSSQEQGSEASLPTRRSLSTGLLKRRKKDSEADRQQRWMSNLENCNDVLSKSLDAMTKAHQTSVAREQQLQSDNKTMELKLSEADHKIKTLEKMFLAQTVETENANKELQQTTYSETQETSELKENLKAVTQLLLSQKEKIDSQTMNLLKVLTAPIGGLSAIGSRTGVIGLESDKQPQGVTPLALLGAAVAGPITEQPISSVLSMKNDSINSGSVSSSAGLFFDFGFRFAPPKQSGTTVFALMLCAGVSFSVSSDPMFHSVHTTHTPLHQINSSSRRLLQDGNVSSPTTFSRVVLFNVIFFGVLTVSFLLTNLLIWTYKSISSHFHKRKCSDASILPSSVKQS